MAGKAMAFPRMKTALKIIMVVPAALFAGLVLYEMTLAHSRIWLLAGIFLGAVLFHGLVESIYQLDVRGLWSHRKQMLVTVALSFALAMVFWLDLSGYDSYLPKMGSIKSMNIEDSSVCMESEHWGKPAAGLEGQEMEAAYNLISDIVSDKPWKDSGQAFHNITVTYTLGHGRKAVRRYNIPVEKYMDQLDWLYQCRDFKEDNCSVLTADSRKISEISVSVFNPDIPYEMMYENVEKKDREEFRKIYSEELAELKYSEVMKEIPVGSLEVFYYSGLDDPGNGAEESNLSATMGITHYIYPSFSKTIEWLTKKGYVDKIQREGQYKIRQITLYRNDGENQMNQVTCTVKDPALIEEVKSKLVPADLVQGGSLLDLDPNVTIDVEYVSGRDVWTVGMQADSETVKKLENAAEK
ncbi:MAG: hypothetical protein IJ137_06105 [Eubacterium sp.]|nr:hypothetical protein [Eubacterium sp.]